MPTLLKRKQNQWWARVILDGEYVTGLFFPPGKRKGPEWTAARNWEVTTTKQLETLIAQGKTLLEAMRQLGLQPSKKLVARLQEQEAEQTVSACSLLLAWGESYLAHAERVWTGQTVSEKNTQMLDFFIFCREEGINSPEVITVPVAYKFLAYVRDKKEAEAREAEALKKEAEAAKAEGGEVPKQKKKGGKIGNPASVANKYRKNLLAAWNWGIDFVEGFPQGTSPFAKVKEFPVDKQDRYVPPENDVVKVLELAQGQDLVMLLVFYFTGARSGEVFRLSWTRDIRLEAGKIRLQDHKTGNGKARTRWYDMHPVLVHALMWWHENRPCMADNVFMQTHCNTAMGLPFKHRSKFCARLCKRAGVKPFVFYSIRHKSARIVFADGGVKAAQSLLGHYRATTTNDYLQEEGLLTGPAVLVDALGDSVIGQAAGSLLKMNLPHELRTHEAECNLNHVTAMVQ